MIIIRTVNLFPHFHTRFPGMTINYVKKHSVIKWSEYEFSKNFILSSKFSFQYIKLHFNRFCSNCYFKLCLVRILRTCISHCKIWQNFRHENLLKIWSNDYNLKKNQNIIFPKNLINNTKNFWQNHCVIPYNLYRKYFIH